MKKIKDQRRPVYEDMLDIECDVADADALEPSGVQNPASILHRRLLYRPSMSETRAELNTVATLVAEKLRTIPLTPPRLRDDLRQVWRMDAMRLDDLAIRVREVIHPKIDDEELVFRFDFAVALLGGTVAAFHLGQHVVRSVRGAQDWTMSGMTLH